MNPRQGRSLLSLYAVDVFLDGNAARLPKTCATGMRVVFKRALAELELHIQVQYAAPLTAMGLTRAKDAKREALLRDHMAPIARIAKLASDSYPALQSLKMPRGEPSTQKLLAFAAGMAEFAAPYREVFVAFGMRATFVEDMNAAIDDVLATLTARSERRGARSGATRGVADTIKACSNYKAVLSAFIESEAHDDIPLIANWRTVQRVGRSMRRRRRASAIPSNQQLGVPAPALPIRDPSRLLPPPRVESVVALRHEEPLAMENM